MTRQPLLEVTDLVVSYATAGGREVHAVNGVSLAVHAGQITAIVGESGSGKSTTAQAIIGLLPGNADIDAGEIRLDGRDLAGLSEKQWRGIRGTRIGLIPQDPNNSLNPVKTIGESVAEGLAVHRRGTAATRKARVLELLEQVGIDDPARRYDQYPHELSGGMRQRVTIAAALGSDPDVLIADEATTALDVTVQKQILVLLERIQEERQMAIIMISHDLGVVSGRTDDLLVLYGGQVAEAGPTRHVFERHAHRYTEALLRAIPSLAAEPHGTFATIPGTPPRPVAEFDRCRFAPRCAHATDACTAGPPPWVADDGNRHGHRCVHPSDPAGAR